MKSYEESDIVKVEVDCVIEDERLVQVYSNGEKQSDFCVHGIKYRWGCDLCEDWILKHKATP